MAGLMFPRPRNEDYALHKCVHMLLEDAESFEAFIADDRVVTTIAPGLDSEAVTLIRGRDFDGMVARGAHPILVVQLQRKLEAREAREPLR